MKRGRRIKRGRRHGVRGARAVASVVFVGGGGEAEAEGADAGGAARGVLVILVIVLAMVVTTVQSSIRTRRGLGPATADEGVERG